MDIFLSILEPHLIFTLTHHICAILTRAANLVISNRFWQMDKRLSPPKVRKPFGCLSRDVPPPKAEKLACDCVRARSERCSSAASSGDQGLRGFAAAKMAGTGPELYLHGDPPYTRVEGGFRTALVAGTTGILPVLEGV